MNIFFKNKEDLKLINAVNFILGYKPKKIQLYKLALLHKSNNFIGVRFVFIEITILINLGYLGFGQEGDS